MTKLELDILSKHIGEWEEYRKNDAEYKQNIFNILAEQKQMIQQYIDADTRRGEEMQARIEELERHKERSMWWLRAIGASLVGLMITFKDVIVENWQKFKDWVF